MDRFVFKESQVSSVNQSVNQSADQDPPTNNTADNEVEDVPIDNTNVGMDNNDDNVIATSIDVNVNTSLDREVSDSLDPRQIEILAEKGPRRDLLIQKGPKDKYSRRFSALFYNRVLPNGEHCDEVFLMR